MKGKAFLVPLLLISMILVGCMRSASGPDDTPAAGPGDTPAVEGPEPEPEPEPEPDPAVPVVSAVSSMITLADQPWIVAPAMVSAYPSKVQISFSGPVDQRSVEVQLIAELKLLPHHFDWLGDQELLIDLKQGCVFLELTAAGAKDARGRTLQAELNPVLALRMPCHGNGYTVVSLPDGQWLQGFPPGGVVVDTQGATGRILGRNGTVYFLWEDGAVRKLADVGRSNWGRLLPGGDILLADGESLRILTPGGQERLRAPIGGEVLAGVLSSDGTEAILMIAEEGGTAAARLQVADLAINKIASVGYQVERATLHWAEGQGHLLAVVEEGTDRELDLTTGETRPLRDGLRIYSPDGRWVVDTKRGGIFPAGEEGAAPTVALTPEMEAGSRRGALWAPDSRHLLMPSGQLLDVELGAEVSRLKRFQGCAAPTPVLLGLVGDRLVGVYYDNCY